MTPTPAPKFKVGDRVKYEVGVPGDGDWYDREGVITEVREGVITEVQEYDWGIRYIIATEVLDDVSGRKIFGHA